MSNSADATDVGDITERYCVEPLLVAGLTAPDAADGSKGDPAGMLVSIDVSAIPGLGVILDRQGAGECFDIVSRWGGEVDQSGESPPRAVVDFFLPDFDLGVSIFIDVDKASDSIRTAIRTGRIFIVDPSRCKRLQEADEIGTELDRLRPLTVSPPDPKPAIALLQQRIDLPAEEYQLESIELSTANQHAALEAFVDGARSVSKVGVQVSGEGPSVIVLVDQSSGSLAGKIEEGVRVEGRWGVMAGEDHSLVLFDAVGPEGHIGRWVMGDPPFELVRAGSNGAHWVVIATELESGENDSQRQIDAGIHAWVPRVEALRTLRFGTSGAGA